MALASSNIRFPNPSFDNETSQDCFLGEATQEFLEYSDDFLGEQTQAFFENDDKDLGENPLGEYDDEQCASETSDLFREDEIEGLNEYLDDFENDDFPQSDTSVLFNANPMKVPLYYQVGSGFEPQPGPSSRGPVFIENDSSENLDNAVIMEEINRRRNRRYDAEEVTYQARIDIEQIPVRLHTTPLFAAVEAVRSLITLLILRCTQNLNQFDLIRFCFMATGLDRPVSTVLMRVADLTVEKVVGAIMHVLQSYQHLKLDDGVTVDVIIVHREAGEGRNRRIINIDVDRLKKKSILMIPYDEEGLCCAKAILYALAHLEKDQRQINSMRNPNRPYLLKKAKELHKNAGVPLGACTHDEIAVFEEYLNVQIAVISAEKLNTVAYKGKNRERRINLFLHKGHYDVIKSLKGFYGSNFYCEPCDKSFDHLENHRCNFVCPICIRKDCSPGQPQRCLDCDRLCRSASCFESHKATPGKRRKSLCDKMYQCRDCCKIILRSICPKHLHQCDTIKCASCKNYVDSSEHRCFLDIVLAKKPSNNIIFFDFETDQSSGEHKVNFAVAQYADGGEKVFKGYTACQDFCAWLFASNHKGYTAIAHNMKGFDGQFIMAWLLEQGIAPSIIPNGSKVMSINHPTLHIKLIDSFNFLPMSLSKLPGCFGLSELKKGYFPHLFNKEENQTYVGSFPDIKHYSPNTMSSETRKDFLEWYNVQEGQQFDFQQEILTYCRSDVDILRRCCLEFRNEFFNITEVDPFSYVTIASACMATYRSKHLVKDSIAMIPVHGYINRTNYSPDAIRWLDFIATKENIFIEHALNGKGERKIDGITVDGFCEETNTVYQFHGCFYHGCLQCFDGEVLNPLNGSSMKALFQKTAAQTSKLRSQGFTVVEEWEHSFKIRLKENTELKEFLLLHEMQDRLIPRDAFYGGRTNAVKLFFEGKMKYVDFTSLYPWVNKYCLYPVGHPEIVTENFETIDKYFGIIRCQVLPPRGLYLPVLPVRCNEKLMFPLCRLCAEDLNQRPCEHKDEERSIIGTWVTEEVKLAVKKGYRVTKIYEVYHFREKSDHLFKSYIDLFLKIKQESSGYPSNCTTAEEKAAYIQQYQEKEGVLLNSLEIRKNPGRRQVAKLALNSFWGRWGMNINKRHLTYVDNFPAFNKMLADPTKNVKDIYLPTPSVAAIVWDSKKEFIPQDTCTNIFLAAFTTSWARMKLYEEMDKLGDAVLYHDTDSIIYASNGENDPPLGNFLGEFTDELGGDFITTFISGGPKNYAYRTNRGKTCCKVRGFTLNFKNSQVLNFDSIRHLVCSLDYSATIPLNDTAKIVRDGKKRKVCNVEQAKMYRLVYNKRVIKEDFSTLPYGY